MSSLKKCVECVKRHKNFLITAHVNLEGDALGSQLAFYKLLKKLGKNAVIVNDDDTPYEYGFLPQKNKIKRFKTGMKNIKFDCFAVLDCSGLSRTGKVYTINKDKKPILNIDHHISNEKFGDVNWIEPAASSCSEMIYKLYKKLRVPFDRESATMLYAGMLTDTGSFHYPNTNSFTHKAVSELLKHNLDIARIYKSVYENIPLRDMKFLSAILPGIKLEAGGKIAYFVIKRNALKNKKLSFDLSEHLLSFARSIKGVEVVLLFKENLRARGEIRINLRSQGKVDVNKIASLFGGGGHKTASGATIHGSIQTIKRKVLARIKMSLK
ncbi:MAG: hypothetical protein A3K83_04060 [Omnitrophica WOR_2 bacterium RBG_13_44_8b]|nr:MAG: hypothetical protein A3K83_04060 [Omnitrophica WOR_2 bacterium RBG_13_44_8b]